MKIAISAYGKDLNAEINPRFGRCDYLLIVDTDDMSVECITNENKDLSGGAGIQTASFVISKGVSAVLTGKCGPNASDVFSASNVQVVTGQTGTAGEAVRRFKEGASVAREPAVERPGAGALAPGSCQSGFEGPGSPYPGAAGASGRGRGGRGGGMGRGGGRGRGGGCGMGRRR